MSPGWARGFQILVLKQSSCAAGLGLLGLGSDSSHKGQGPLYGQLSYATKAGRVEKRVVYYIVDDSINDEDRHVVPGLSQPLVWMCDMQYVTGQ